MEIWNLVFMQFDQSPDGSRSPLPAPSVDTGAGLERIAAVMQDVPSNFDSDLFTKIIERGEAAVGVPYDRGPKGVSYRVLADHARAVAFLLADEVYPRSEGRGYVLRRILRRAVRHAYLLGRREPTLVHMADEVVQQMGSVYPELEEKAVEIRSWTKAEEERFLETIGDGLRRLDDIIAQPAGTIPGVEAFKLYDTFGFPSPWEEGSQRNHLFVYGWRNDEWKPLWCSSPIADPIVDVAVGDVDGDGANELVVLEGSYDDALDEPACHVAVWRWNGWGFALQWRSPAGVHENLTLRDANSEDILDFVTVQH